MISNPVKSFSELPLSLTVAEVSSVLRIGKAATYGLVRSGVLKSIRVGNSIRVPRHALEEFWRSIGS